MGYLDNTGLTYLWERIKAYIAGLGFYTKPSTGIPASDIESGVIPTVPTTLSSFTDDLGSNPTHTHSQYLTSAPVTSVNGQTGAVSLTIPTVPSNIVTGTSSSYTIWVGTQAQYEAISTKDATTIYLITGS